MVTFLRFVNIFNTMQANLENMWTILRKLKLGIPAQKCYGDYKVYSPDQIRLNVAAVEEQLGGTADENIYDVNDNEETLKIAADLFFYLNSCSNDLEPWILFYRELFLYKSPNQIILTLNRILKVRESPENQDLKIVAQKLFKRISIMFSLQYPTLKDIRNGRLQKRVSSHHNGKVVKIAYIILYLIRS